MNSRVNKALKPSSPFDDFVRLEQVRLLEDDQAAEQPELATDSSFEPAIIARADALIVEREWRATLAAPDRLYRFFRTGLMLLALVLGVLAVSNALAGAESQRVINIYWLLLVLLGFNTVSLLLWLFGCVAQAAGLIGGTVGNLPLVFHRLATRIKPKARYPQYTAWFNTRFQGKVGLWRVSAEGHQLWLLYLLAGFVGLLFLFSVRQYDFVWGSTLLSENVFIALTELLSKPLHHFGLSPPDAAQIIASRSGEAGVAPSVLESGIRRQWALFLLGSLFLYGVLPRALCFAVSRWVLTRQEQGYRPDFYLPYYVELRHRQQPFSSEAEVVDADQAANPPSALTTNEAASGFQSLPENACRIGIELSESQAQYVDINVVDRRSQQQALDALQQGHDQVALLVVSQQTTADRGVKRRIEQLVNGRKNSWLLIHANPSATAPHSSLEQWYQLAQTVGIAVDNIRHINLLDSGWAAS